MKDFRPQIFLIVLLGFALAGGFLYVGATESASVLAGVLITGLGYKVLESNGK